MPNPIVNRRVVVSSGGVPVEIGTIIDSSILAEDVFNSSKWTYEGAGSVDSFDSSGIEFSGGTDSLNSILKYTAMPINLESCVITWRFILSGTDASNGVVGCGLVSSLGLNRHFVLINCRTGASKGNLLLFYANGYDQETNPTLIPFTDGDEVEIRMTKTLLSYTFDCRNYTQLSSYISLSKNLSITYSVGANEIPNISYPSVYNYDGTNKLTYFNVSSTEYKYADLLFIGDSKTQGFYANSGANRFSNQYALNKSIQIVNLAGQSQTLTDYVLLNNLITVLRPNKLIMLAAFRNNISGGTWNATAKSNYQSIVTNAESFGCEVWHALSIPEGLDQSPGDVWVEANYSPSRIIDSPPTFNVGTDTSDGTHPNSTTGQEKIKDNLIASSLY